MSLVTRRLEGQRPGPHLLVLAGIHGDEFEPIAAVAELARRWPPAGWRGRLTLVPVANQSAFELGTRCAADGLDLARVFPGRAGGSVTEQAACELNELIRTADALVDLHTGGQVLRLLPLAGYMLVDDVGLLEKQRRMATAMNLPVVWGTSAKLDGRSMSAARDAGVPAIYAEFGGGGGFDPQAVLTYVDGCLNVAALLGMIDRQPPPPHVRWWVEDHRLSSGHMQVQHPAPAMGLFSAEVEVGQWIAAGDTLGLVQDPLTDAQWTISAAESGVVLGLRSFARVCAGDALAILLPCDGPGRTTIDGSGNMQRGNSTD